MSVGDLKYKILSLSDFRIRKTAKTVSIKIKVKRDALLTFKVSIKCFK